MTRHRGRRDQAARAALAPEVAAGRARCWACGLPITPGQAWDAGHLEDLATGGHPAGPRRPEHRHPADCPAGGNRRRGAMLGLAIRTGRLARRPRRLAEFLGAGPVAEATPVARFSPPTKTVSNRTTTSQDRTELDQP